jgi:NEDD4-binding protein 2
MKTLLLIRGLPGSGKTTLARTLEARITGSFEVCADDYFMVDGEYKFDAAKLEEVHRLCQLGTRLALKDGASFVIVHNTFSTRKELQPYFNMAQDLDYRVQVVDLFNAGLSIDELVRRNVHGVPRSTVKRMWDRWDHDWRLKAEKEQDKYKPEIRACISPQEPATAKKPWWDR